MLRKVALITALMCAVALPSVPVHAARRGFTILATADGTKAEFYYLTSLGSAGTGTGWVAGDRVGYGCAYAFLRSGRTLVGRVTFIRIEYARINDRYMNEAERYYDGKRYKGHHHQLNDCPKASEAYEDASGPVGPAPIVTFSDAATGAVLEVRDFTTIEQHGGGAPWEFQVVSSGPHRVRIVGYQSDEPVLAIYYDRLSTTIKMSVSQ